MKRAERICYITQILTDDPNKDHSLGSFAVACGCAKSSISEDIQSVRAAMEATGLGYLETTAGAKGGVRFVPYISLEKAREFLTELKARFEEPDRDLRGGFMYTSDIMFDPGCAKGMARIFARRFAASEADVVVTVETKGIAIAAFTAELLGLPMVVLRREQRISEGSTVSINYLSGSTDRIQKMSLSKRAVAPGSKAVIIDDFMRGGGSISGMKEMLGEFDVQTVGIGVVVAAGNGRNRAASIGDVYALLSMDESGGKVSFKVNPLK